MPDAPALPPRPRSDRDDALAVVRRLREAGHVAYFAGGCVRDQLLGLTPKDYDVATDAPPQRVRELFTRTDAVGAAFGVILVRHRRSQIEVATFRTDLEYRDGRRPEGVRFATAEQDAQRRDFTINGLFFDPLEDRVIDYVGGQADLEARVVRAIGEPDRRFEEDHLRLLRAVRFATRFRFKIDPATEDAIVRHAAQLARISPERIAEELLLILAPPGRTLAWALLEKYHLSAVVFRFLKLPWELPASPPPTATHIPSCLFLRTQDAVAVGRAVAGAGRG
jgi:poly(A) polymerase